jgi:cytochrome P450
MFDPVQFAALQNRYPSYRRLRDEAPVLTVELGPVSVRLLTRYEDVAAILRNPQSRVKPLDAGGDPAGLGNGAAAAMFNAQLVLADPPDHDRLRRLVSPAFTQQAIKPLQAWIEDKVAQRIGELAEQREFDLVADLAAYVPASTILHILGVPLSDWQPLISRVPDFLNFFSPFPISKEQRDACEAACQFYIDYFGAIVDERRAAPGDDIVGKLITAHDQDDQLSRIELLAILHAFLNAGFETTMSALGSGMWGMLSQRLPWQQLCADPNLAGTALEETLRWEAPIHFLRRYPAQDVTLHGTTIHAGEAVLLGLASANRDERRFPDPDRIDIHRADKAHVTFGGGRHFCIGAQLAKLEARTTLAALARKLPQLELIDTEPERQMNLMFHAIKRMKVHTGTPSQAR